MMSYLKSVLASAVILAAASAPSRAAVELSTYADAKGFINVQELTCAQLSNTYQEDADMLAA